MDPNGDGDPADGIDGWRLDVATDMPDQFWVDWNAFARSINPNVYTVAECWDDASQYCTRCGFSATMNYHGFAMPVKAYLVDGRLAPSVAGKLLHERSQAFNPTARHALLSLIDSHDTPRVASMIVNRPRSGTYINPDRFDYDLGKQSSIRHWEEYNVRMPSAVERRIQKMVAVMQVAFVGAPMVYYGTEAGMWGGDDPCDRMPMKWTDIDHDLWQFYRAALKLRQELPALSSDEMEIVSTDDAARALAFKRRGPDRDVYALFNRGRKPTTFEFPCSSGEVTIALTTSGNVEPVCIEHEDGQVRVTLPGLAATLVAPGSKVK
jgi:glycosidase